MRKVVATIISVLMLALVLFGCGGMASDAGITVVATSFSLYDWARNVAEGVEDVNVILLIGNGSDVHSYQPTVADVAKISSCDLFLYVGGESDAWVTKALENKINEDRVVLSLMASDAVESLNEETVEGMESEEHEEESEEAAEEPEKDEHIWLSLKNASACTKLIAETLSEIDEKNSAAYEKNAEEYAETLNELDKEFAAAVSQAENKTMIFGDRFPFRYFANDYGLTYYAPFAGCSAETEASFETVAFLAKKVKELDADTIFILASGNEKLAKTIIEGTDAEIAEVNSLENVTQKEADNGATYIDIMRANMETFKKAIK